MQKMPDEIEKKIIEKDGTLIAICSVIVMVLVWLTLSGPPKETRKYSKACYEICKHQVDDEYKFEAGGFLVRTKFIVEMGECMDDCIDFSEAIDEDNNKSIAN